MTVYASFDAQTQYEPADLMQRDADWIAPGVLTSNDLKVTAQSPAAMAVNVSGAAQNASGGSAWLAGGYRLYNDSTLALTISAANNTNPRIDLIVAGVNTSTNPYTPEIKVITGSPAASPTAPNTPSGYLALAQVYVAANATSISQANITDERTIASLQGNASALTGITPSQIGAAPSASGIPYGVDSGAVNAIAVTVSPAPAAYVDGYSVKVKVVNTTTGAATLNVNGLGAIAIKNADGSAVGSGDLQAGIPRIFTYVAGSPAAFIAAGSGGLSASGTATPADVLPTVTFTSQGGRDQQGAMQTVAGGNTIIPGTANQTAIAASTYAQAAITVAGDPNLIAASIKAGLKVFNVTGTFTADATATAAQILSGATAYVNGAKLSGTMPNNGSPTKQPGDSIAPGYYSGGSVAAPTSGSQAFTTAGNTNWTVPSGVTGITVEAWGGGGGSAGSTSTGGAAAGGGGGWSIQHFDVTPGQVITVNVGAGGAGGSAGGGAGQGGGGSGINGTLFAYGGAGAPGANTGGSGGYGNGIGYTDGQAGQNTQGTGISNGGQGASSGTISGGAGGSGSMAASQPGGGGGGPNSGNYAGYPGAPGKVIIHW